MTMYILPRDQVPALLAAWQKEASPVILLTQVGDSVERAMALEEGADDYLNKPFDPHELVARIRAVLRRVEPAKSAADAPLTIDEDLEIDFPHRAVIVRGDAFRAWSAWRNRA